MEKSIQIGTYMRELRERKGLTRAQVSDKSGIGYKMLWEYENGRVSLSVDVLARWCKGLRVRLSTPFRHFEEVKKTKS